MNYRKRAREAIRLEAAALSKVGAGLGPSFDAAIRLLLDCLRKNGKIAVTGVGKCLHIAEKISATLASTGSPSVILNAVQAMHGDLGILAKGDALLVLSYSGESEEILALVPLARRQGAKIAAITASSDSALGRCSDVVVPAAVAREACPFNMVPTASTTAMLALGDAIAVVLLEARGFKKHDYARLHPGGAIGRSLLLRASDIMRTGSRLAVVGRRARVRDAIVAMTGARSGSAAVVDGKGKVLGIFTDGDLRRFLPKHARLLEMPVEKVMTASPIAVRDTKLATEVLDIYEKHNIDDVLVVDEKGRLRGAIDIQDLPRFKIL